MNESMPVALATGNDWRALEDGRPLPGAAAVTIPSLTHGTRAKTAVEGEAREIRDLRFGIVGVAAVQDPTAGNEPQASGREFRARELAEVDGAVGLCAELLRQSAPLATEGNPARPHDAARPKRGQAAAGATPKSRNHRRPAIGIRARSRCEAARS